MKKQLMDSCLRTRYRNCQNWRFHHYRWWGWVSIGWFASIIISSQHHTWFNRVPCAIIQVSGFQRITRPTARQTAGGWSASHEANGVRPLASDVATLDWHRMQKHCDFRAK